MNNLDKQYTALLQDILDNGVKKSDRTGTGTLSVFGRQIRHKMSEGFPLLTTKKMYMKGITTELLWFLRGNTNIKYLIDNDCHIWDGDAYKNYCKNCVTNDFKIDENGEMRLMTMDEFVLQFKKDDKVFINTWGDLGPIYGKQWRQWDLSPETEIFDFGKNDDGSNYPISRFKRIDQIANLINDLKTNPDDRGLIVSAWNVGELKDMVLRPCHNYFQVYTRELSSQERVKLYEQKTNAETSFFPVLSETLDFHNIPTRAISLMWNQRSVDTFLGLPFNIASYGLLLEIIAKEVNMVPDELIGNLGDVHLYLNHIEQAKEQITRTPYELPILIINGDEPSIIEKPQYWKPIDFIVKDYQSHKPIKAPLSN